MSMSTSFIWQEDSFVSVLSWRFLEIKGEVIVVPFALVAHAEGFLANLEISGIEIRPEDFSLLLT